MFVLKAARIVAGNLKPRLLPAIAGALALCITLGASVQAAVIHVVDGSGQLTGAKNVDLGVLGLFDVVFVEGSYNSLFAGSFDFTTSGDAEAAAQALIDDVFFDTGLGNFGSDPTSIFGCESTNSCQVEIPYSLSSTVVSVYKARVKGTAPGVNDVSSSAVPLFADTTSDDVNVYARFTEVSPVPPVSVSLPLVPLYQDP